MTKSNCSDIDGDKSNTGFASTSDATTTDGSVVDCRMVEEEERLLIENEKTEAEEVLTPMEAQIQSDEELARQSDAEMKAMRYRKLMHLLDSSKMYSLILKDRIKEELKDRDMENSRSKKGSGSQNKKKNQGDYKLGDVISEESIDENLLNNEEKHSKPFVEDDDYFKEVRVTDLGHTVSYKQPILLEGGAMRDYQLKGLDWLKVLFTKGVNGILADEMGLGKTIQVISFICHMIEQNIKGPFLIVAPLTTISNWMSEFKRFAPKVPTMLYHGTEEQRRNLLPKIFSMTKVLDTTVHKVVITSFQVPLKDKAELRKINWYYLIVDEGQRIKNHNSMLSRTLREFNTIGRLLLTGTPLQNDLSELWSLLNFLLPEIFTALDVFEMWFDIRELESNGTSFMAEKFNVDVVTTLQEILVPFLLRREKKDVDLKLPPKREILIYCPLTPRQKKLYESILDRSIELLIKPKENIDVNAPLPKRRCFLNSPFGKIKCEEPAKVKREKKKTKVKKEKAVKADVVEEAEEEERFVTKLSLQNPQMQLRKVVNHPYLIQYPLEPGTENLRIDEELVTQSGKMLVLDAMLSKLKARNHKVIVFSYFKLVLDILEDHAIMRGYKYCRLDGQLNADERNEEINKFISDPEIFVFFITMRSGGLGINLTAADTVIFYDSDWNPQVNLQSQDRCHRIGQTKPVVVYRLCVKGTVDEKIIERGNAKRRLEKMILQKGKYTLNSSTSKNLNLMDLHELKSLLESTDHDAVINSNGFVLSDEQLDELLDRSSMSETKETNDGEKNLRENKDSKFKVLS